MDRHYVLGAMSGTSLDGLDLALCEFSKTNNWEYRIVDATNIPYDDSLKHALGKAHALNITDFLALELRYSKWHAAQIHDFLNTQPHKPSLVACHGHTVIHQPERELTYQMLSGHVVCNALNLPVICDFRRADLSLGGQGAPLVPLGDQLLFPNYKACINLGGFVNISFVENNKQLAFDICAFNTVSNWLAEKLNLPYDDRGLIAKGGELIPQLSRQLDSLPFYQQKGPKSLGIEWVRHEVFPLLDTQEHSVADLLHTFIKHCASQTAKSLTSLPEGDLLVTGGGAYNTFFVTSLQDELGQNHKIVIPDPAIIEYKEALIFALLGLLRSQNSVNILSSVTGASKDHSGGVIYQPA